MIDWWMRSALVRVFLTFTGIALSVIFGQKLLFFIFFVLYVEALFEYNWRKHAESERKASGEV